MQPPNSCNKVKFVRPDSVHMGFYKAFMLDGTLPPKKEQFEIESLLSKLINPYLGYRGLYEGGDNPSVYANILCSRTDFVKGASGGRRLSRPLSVQTPQAATLNQLFHNAARKARLNS
ncbi:hypothetical protein GQR58_008925 [Nymphon striatum]|nr:hypothetical protein GQR58_008925 [Nymphon striatum]